MEQEQNTAREISATKAAFMARCPVCRQGPIFTGSWARSNFLETHKNCPVCGTAYEAEPGFFIGAMYVSYGFNVATLITVGLLVYLLFNPESAWVYIGAILTVTFLAIPFTSRASRVIFLYLFGPLKYDPTKRKLHTK